MQLRASHIWDGPGPVLSDHAIGILGDCIGYICPTAEAPHDPETIDLPHIILLPGFVNAHCHMDLSHLRGKISYTDSFADWIRSVVPAREELTEGDIRRASRELQHSGVTALFDHVGPFSELAYIMDTPFRKRLFLEIIGTTEESAIESWVRQQDRALQLRRHGIDATPSPHATYSVHPEVFSAIIATPALSREKQSRLDTLDRHAPPCGARDDMLSIHCAEGAEEWEMVTGGCGKLAEFLRWRANGHPSPIQFLAMNSLLPPSPWLAVHCNMLTDDDIVLLKRSHATVVHCPRSHRYFHHPPFPLERLQQAGVPVAIGTDSLASCPNFDFLEELRTLREEFGFLSTDDILLMATNSALPLTPTLSHKGRGGLSAGAFADIIGLPLQNDLLEGPVTFSMIGGRRVI